MASSADDSSGIDVGDVLLGKLRVDRILGRGGMGTVYRVTHLGTRHARALKVLNPELSLHSEALARFQREATVSATIPRANVVETLDCGTLEDGRHYVLMELLEGHSLGHELDGGRRLPLPRIARLLAEAAVGLGAAHDAAIVHRDIKPDNLFVVEPETSRERLKILDFGIACFRNDRDALGGLTGENVILGTPLYMAPEQIVAANQADGRADIYALGVILYEALSGRKPYTATNFMELVAHIVEGEMVPLAELATGLPPEAYRVVERAMARRKEDRFRSARELARALYALAGDDTEVRSAVDALGATLDVTLVEAMRVASADAPREDRPAEQPQSSSSSVPSVPSLSAPVPPHPTGGTVIAWAAAATSVVVLVAGVMYQAPPSTVDARGSAVAVPASAPPDAAPPGVPDAPDDLDAAHGLDGGNEGTRAPAIDAVEPDVRTPRAPPTTTRSSRPDAGRRRTGGLLDPDEIYGGVP